VFSLAALAVLGAAAWLAPTVAVLTSLRDRPLEAALAGIAGWAMQLQGLDVTTAARSSTDLLVIDELAGGARTHDLANSVKQLQAKPDGTRRLVLAHLSIGGSRSDRGERRARFWEQAWQARIAGGPSSALDRVLAAGFDGVYLDHADVHRRWAGERASASEDLVDLVERIARQGRTWQPSFIVVLQNADELLDQPRVRATLDAVARCDLLYGERGSDVANPPEHVATRIAQLKRARRDGLPAFVMEHVTRSETVAEARRVLDDHGFLSYFAPRALDRLVSQD